MTTRISDARPVYRQTDNAITADGRELIVGIVKGDVLTLKPKGRQAASVKRVPLAAIARHADMLISDDGQAPKLEAVTDFEQRDGPLRGRVVVQLLHGDTLAFRIQGSKHELLLPISVAYLKAAERAARKAKEDKGQEKQMKRVFAGAGR